METAMMAMVMVGVGLTGSVLAMLFTRRKLDSLPLPAVGANFRLRAIAGIYRSKFVGFERDGWRLTSPLQRNQYVPLEPGESVTVEAPCSGGVYLYRARILRKASESDDLVVAAPSGIKPVNRRTEFRMKMDMAVLLDSEGAHMVDISRQGARLKASLRFRRGDRVKLEFDDVMVYAWIIDLWPTAAGDEHPAELRVRFEEPIELPIRKAGSQRRALRNRLSW